MFFTVSNKDFKNALVTAYKAVASKPVIPILYNLLFRIEKNKVTITGSNIDNVMAATIDVVDVDEDAVFTVDASKFVNLMKEIPDVPVTVKYLKDTNEVEVSYVDGNYRMTATDGGARPHNEADHKNIVLACKTDWLIRGIDNTIHAVGTDDFHPQMMGLCMDIFEDKMVFVCTDTRILCKYVINGLSLNFRRTLIIPTAAAMLIRSMLSPGEEVAISIGDKSIEVKTLTCSINARLYVGKYPQYERVIPLDNSNMIVFEKAKLAQAVKRVDSFVDSGGVAQMVALEISNDNINVQGQNSSFQSNAEENVACVSQDAPIRIGFSGKKFIDAVTKTPGSKLILKYSLPSRPVIIMPEEPDGVGELISVLMPVNLPNV